MTSIDNLADEIMKGLTEYAELTNENMKKAVRKTATSVKKEISSKAPKKTGSYAKSWTAKKKKENSHSLEMTVHSKNKISWHTFWSMVMPNVAAAELQVNHILHLQRKMEYKCLKILSRRHYHDL